MKLYLTSSNIIENIVNNENTNDVNCLENIDIDGTKDHIMETATLKTIVLLRILHHLNAYPGILSKHPLYEYVLIEPAHDYYNRTCGR